MSDLHDRLELGPLDPGYRDPGFWVRFHSRVMARAQDELDRRRMARELGIADTVFAWRGFLVPVTLLAAALAGIFLMGGGSTREEPIQVMALEEFMTEDLNLFSHSGVLSPEGRVTRGVFASTEGGF